MLLRRRAEEILELVDKTEKELTEQDETIAGTVSIGCGDLAAVRRLPDLFRSFQERYPAVTFGLYTAAADHIRDRMDRGLTDIGMLLEPINLEKYEYIRLANQEQWVAVMHPDSPLAKLDRITPEDLRGQPLILPYRTNFQSELAHWLGVEYEKLNVRFTANLPSVSSIMAHNKLAYGLLIQGSISFWDKNKITYRPLWPELTATTVLAWKRKQPFGLAAEKFIEFLKETLPEK